tara:strand:- start:2159 stop:4048 length:1890 start_codon:yes stop_codon:yes gene_type:complete
MLDDNKAQLEMDLIMNEQVDPVSGNIAPIGSKPEEVRDDIDIRVSTGEYVINAQTVRYFGEDFFNELQEAASEGFKRIKKGEELPFRDDELDTEDDQAEEVEPEGFAYGGFVKGYDEGGSVVPEPVGGGYGQYGGTGSAFTGYQSKVFVNDATNQQITIFHFNGRPLSRIPKGFREKGETPLEEQTIAAATDSTDANEGLTDEIKKSSTDWRNKNVESWSDDEYASYYAQLNSNIKSGKSALDLDEGEQLVTSLLSGPFGLLGKVFGADSAIESLMKKQKLKRAEDIFNHVSTLEDTDPVKNDTRYILGSMLGKDGYDPVVANPYKTFDYEEGDYTSLKEGDELDIYGMPTEKALSDRGLSSSSILDLNKLTPLGEEYDVEKYYAAGGVRPRGRPPTLESGKIGVKAPKGKYDPTKASASAGATTNTLTTKEQAAFDNAVDSGNDRLANHYVAVNRLRDKQDSYAQGNMSREEGAALGLSNTDMDQADKYGGSVATAIATGTAANQGLGAPARVVTDDSPAGSDSGDKDEDSCVIATHGISTGGFSLLDKAKAELWCERTYHGKWYGEAFRRGYRHAGNKAIEKGKAAKHYQEFKDFVSYGRGLKKGVKPAMNYYLRTTQFFLTGLFVK